MSDTRNHTTRAQLADVLGATLADYPRDKGRTFSEKLADALLASDAIAAVRAAAVAETTAAIEGILADWEVLAGYGVDEMFRGRLRAALSGGRTALDTTLAQAWDEGHDACCDVAREYHDPDVDASNPYRADTGADQ